jgi:outer membrane protein
MPGLRSAIAIALAFAPLAGCATSALDMAPQRPDQPWRPATTAEGEILPGTKEASSLTSDYTLPANKSLAYVSVSPALSTAKIYSLAELIDVAESNNPTTRIAWDDARRAALAAGIAESAYLPRMSITAIDGVQGGSAQQSALGLNVSSNDTVRGSVSAVSMEWLLFDFGERDAVNVAAKQASVISNIAFTAAHQKVIYDVAIAFYAYSAARARLATAVQSLKDAKAIEAAAEDRYQKGIGTIVESSQSRQATAQANLAAVQASGRVQDAYLSLISAMGISPLAKINVADVSGRKLSPSVMAPVETIIAESLSRRPDVLSAYAAQKASLAKARATEAEFMPKLFVSANGSYNSGGLNVSALPSVGGQAPTVNINGSRFGGAVFAGVTMPLYDGGTRDAQLQQARADIDSADAKLTHVRDEAVRQIVLADNALRTSLSAYSASQSLIVATRTTFDAALASYRHGVGSITDLNLAETQLLQAKNAASDAYSTALAAAATLALSTGALGGAPH